MKKIFAQVLFFALFAVLHFLFAWWNFSRSLGESVSMDSSSYRMTYFYTSEHVLGITWGLFAAFFLYALLKYLESKQYAVVLRGICYCTAVFVVLYVLLGGSKGFMFDFYMTRIGSIYIVISKYATLLAALIAVVTGYIYIKKKSKIV